MKRVLIVFAAALFAVALYAVAAPASEQAVTPRQFAALSKKVTALTKRATNLEKELGGLESCMGAVPIGRFGDPNGTFGYLYDNSAASSIYTTALDVTDAAHASAYALVTDAECASIFNGRTKTVASLLHTKLAK